MTTNTSKNRNGAALKRSTLSLVLLVVLFGTFSATWALDPVLMQPESDCTFGDTNRVAWQLPAGVTDAMITGYLIKVIPDVGTEHIVPAVDLWPDPSSDVTHIGAIRWAAVGGRRTPEDVPLVGRNGFAVQYEVVGGEFSEWSSIVYTTQDAAPPNVTVDPLPACSHDALINLTIHADDIGCGLVGGFELWYRTTPITGEWESAGVSINVVPLRAHIDTFMTFNTSTHGGDGYYEFFVYGIDGLGNRLRMIPREQVTTQVDTRAPSGTLDPLPLYTNDTRIVLGYHITETGISGGIDTVLISHSINAGTPVVDRRIYVGDTTGTVNDTVVFIAPVNGAYRFFVQGVDCAGNVETLPETADASTFVDTQNPAIDNYVTVDRTAANTRTESIAELGWTNSDSIYVDMTNPHDVDLGGVGINSGLEFVRIGLNPAMAPFTEYPFSGDRYTYALPDVPGSHSVYAGVVDRAGNVSWSSVVDRPIILDTQAPEIAEISVFDLAGVDTARTCENEVSVRVRLNSAAGSAYKVFMTTRESDLNSIAASAWQNYDGASPVTNWTFPPAPTTPYGVVNFWVVVKDSAGNISNTLQDQIRYESCDIPSAHIVSISAPPGVPHYTNQALLHVTIAITSRYVDSLRLWIDYSTYHRSWPVVSGTPRDTTVDFTIDATEMVDGCKLLHLQPFSITGLRDGAVDTMTVVLDRSRPIIPESNFRVADITSACDATRQIWLADSGYTNDPEVDVVINATDAGGACLSSGRYIAVISSGANVDSMVYHDILRFSMPGTDGLQNVNVQVRDSAGNWSATGTREVYLDTNRPVITTFQLKDTETNSTVETDETTVGFNLSVNDGSRSFNDWFALTETRSHYPCDLTWRPMSGTHDYTFAAPTPGLKKVYIAVRDFAGNISAIDSATIVFQPGVTVRIVPFDRSRTPHDTLRTNEQQIKVTFTLSGASPDSFKFYEFGTDPASVRFLPWIDDSMTYDARLTAGEGLKNICALVKSEGGAVSSPACHEITLDMTPPVIDIRTTAEDTTAADNFPTTFRAATNWANDLNIRCTPGLFTDALSPIDSIRIKGAIESRIWSGGPVSLLDTMIDARYPLRSVGLILQGGTDHAARPIFFSAHDSADNWGDDPVHYTLGGVDTLHFNYDFTPPEAAFAGAFNRDDTLATQPPASIPVHVSDLPGGYVWKVFIWRADQPGGRFEHTGLSIAPDGVVQVPFTTIPYEYNTVFRLVTMAVDSAGNPSEPDSLWIQIARDTVVIVPRMEDPQDAGDSVYTGRQTVKVLVNLNGFNANEIAYSENRDSVALNYVPYQPLTTDLTYTFRTATNETKHLYVRTKAQNVYSDVAEATIILDTQAPTLQGIQLCDPANPSDTTWVDGFEVLVKLFGAADAAPGELQDIWVSETDTSWANARAFPVTADMTALFTFVNKSSGEGDGVTNTKQGMRRAWVKLRDRAENESVVMIDSITVDLEGYKVVNYPNPFNPDKGQTTFIRVKVKQVGNPIEVKIFDPFGNLVKTFNVNSTERLNNIRWDGTNDNGDKVGNGGYIGLINVNGETQKRKIAVWKGESK